MKHRPNHRLVGSINIGVYGHTSAGKTRFLFQLLDGWDTSGRILARSANCESFLSTIRSDINAHGTSQTTTATLCDISVRVVLNDGDEPVELVFRDLRGEVLSIELDKPSLDRDDHMLRQMNECDAFLFFFDPSNSACGEPLKEHHSNERERAERFVEHVLATRQNVYLPIMFVQTHLDLWENDLELKQKAADWLVQVNASLKKLYKRHLRRHFPEILCDCSKTQDALSSVRGREVERPITGIVELVRGAQRFAAKTRSKAVWPLLSGVGIVLLALTLLLGMIAFDSSAPQPPGAPPTPPIPITDGEVVTSLKELQTTLKAHAPNGQLPTREDAERVNRHLRWISLASNATKDPTSEYSELPEETKEKIDSALGTITNLIQVKMNAIGAPVSSEQLNVLAGYLEGIQNEQATTKVAQLQSAFWDVTRKYAIDLSAAVIRRRRDVGSAPDDTIDEVLKTLRQLTDEIDGYKVGPAAKRSDILSELRTAATFCEVRKADGSYPVSLHVVAATYTSDQPHSLEWRGIRIHSPDQPPFLIGLAANEISTSTLELKTSKATYELRLGLGKPVTCTLLQCDATGQNWTVLHEFDLLTGLSGLSLADLGLGCVLFEHPDMEQSLSWGGYNIKVKLTDLPKVPSLIWDAVRLSVEERKS